MAIEVEVRTVRLEPAPPRLAALRAHLSDAEREREARLLRAESRGRFVAARGWLREVLAERLGVTPAAVPIAAGPNGKPQLGTSGEIGLRFNLSHSGSWALLALAEDAEVGADIERHSVRRDVDGLARRVLSPGELRDWDAIAGVDARAERFFAIWTRKEAYAKGLGEGLGLVMREVSLEDAGGGRFAVGEWLVADVQAPASYSAAIAVEHPAGDDVRVAQVPAEQLDR